MSALLMHALQYAVYGIELALGAALILKRRWRKIKGFSVYVIGLISSDAVIRPAVLYQFGWSSWQYRYIYWSTDVLLTLGAFLLISCLFRHACEEKDELWAALRRGLSAVFVVVLVISFYSFSQDHSKAFASFILNFQQNLYFICLVLNTLLYIMMHQIGCSDDYLGLLVCGLGIQFAGPAASFALIHLTSGDHAFVSLAYYVGPMCTLGMLLSWLYAVTREPQLMPVRAPRRRHQVPVLAE
jgi:hypothetical protein